MEFVSNTNLGNRKNHSKNPVYIITSARSGSPTPDVSEYFSDDLEQRTISLSDTIVVISNVFFPSLVEFVFPNSVGWVNRLIGKIILKWVISVSNSLILGETEWQVSVESVIS